MTILFLPPPKGGNCGNGEIGIPLPGEVVLSEGETRWRSSLVDIRFRARLRKCEKKPFWEDERERLVDGGIS